MTRRRTVVVELIRVDLAGIAGSGPARVLSSSDHVDTLICSVSVLTCTNGLVDLSLKRAYQSPAR